MCLQPNLMDDKPLISWQIIWNASTKAYTSMLKNLFWDFRNQPLHPPLKVSHGLLQLLLSFIITFRQTFIYSFNVSLIQSIFFSIRLWITDWLPACPPAIAAAGGVATAAVYGMNLPIFLGFFFSFSIFCLHKLKKKNSLNFNFKTCKHLRAVFRVFLAKKVSTTSSKNT